MDVTIPAWQRREIERTDLLNRIQREIFAECEEGTYKDFEPRLLREVVSEFCTRCLASSVSSGESSQLLILDDEIRWWAQKNIYVPTSGFSRAKEEDHALLAMLLEKHLLPSATSRFLGGLQRLETLNPQKIFHAKGAMEEVSFPEDL